MQVEHLLSVLWRRKWLVSLTVLAALVIAQLGIRTVNPTYSATATVRVSQVRPDSVSGSSLSYGERVMNTYAQILKSRPTLRRVVQELGLELDAGQLIDAVAVEVIPETELLAITVEHRDPGVAMALANQLALAMVNEGENVFRGQADSVAEALRAEIGALGKALVEDRTTLVSLSREAEAQETVDPALEAGIQELELRIRYREETYASLLGQLDAMGAGGRLLAAAITIVDPAVMPEGSSLPSAPMVAALAVMLGLAGGAGLALISEHFDPRVQSAQQLEQLTDMDVAMAIPAVRLSRRERRGAVRFDRQRGEAWEAYRALGRMVLKDAQTRGAKSLVITSAEGRAGRSTAVLNLALSLVASGWQVIVIDGDLRRPQLHAALNLPNLRGLTSVLRGQCLVRDAVMESGVAGLSVLGSGPQDPAPGAIVGSPRFEPLLRELETMADLVLLDSPPILDYADALELAAVAHRVLFIAAEERSIKAEVAEAARRLSRTHGVMGALMLNKANHWQAAGEGNSQSAFRVAGDRVSIPLRPNLAIGSADTGAEREE